jgi:hypothetical protein
MAGLGRWAHCYCNQRVHGGCRIQAQGVPAVIVGGAVRDVILGAVPHDFDIAAGLGTHELLELFPGSEQSRNRVGTVIVTEASTRLEITPLRSFGHAPSNSLWWVNLARCGAPPSRAAKCGAPACSWFPLVPRTCNKTANVGLKPRNAELAELASLWGVVHGHRSIAQLVRPGLSPSGSIMPDVPMDVLLLTCHAGSLPCSSRDRAV